MFMEAFFWSVELPLLHNFARLTNTGHTLQQPRKWLAAADWKNASWGQFDVRVETTTTLLLRTF